MEVDAMIANARATATQGGDRGWPLCVACAVMEKGVGFGRGVNATCQGCFDKYCYRPGIAGGVS